MWPKPSISSDEQKRLYVEAQCMVEGNDAAEHVDDDVQNFRAQLQFVIGNYILFPEQIRPGMESALDALPFNGHALRDAFIAAIALRRGRQELERFVVDMDMGGAGAATVGSGDSNPPTLDLSAAYDDFVWKEGEPDIGFGDGLEFAMTADDEENFATMEPGRALVESMHWFYRQLIARCEAKISYLAKVSPVQHALAIDEIQAIKVLTTQLIYRPDGDQFT